jgi:hypothetical protein
VPLTLDDTARAWLAGAVAMNQPTARLPPSEQQARRRRLVVPAGIAVLIVGAVALGVYQSTAARRELAAAIAETNCLDPSWRFEDLEAQRHLPPDEQNAALQVLRVHSLLPRNWDYRPDEEPSQLIEWLKSLPPERRLDESQARRLGAEAQRVGPALGPARKLADMPEGRYPVAWSADVFSTPHPWLDTVLSVSALLRLDGLLHSEAGDPYGALTSARALLNLGRSLGDEPFFQGPVTRGVRRRDAVRVVERVLGQGQPSEGALAAVQDAFTREVGVPLLLTHFRGERAFMHIFLSQVDEGNHRISELSCVPARGLRAHAETYLGRVRAWQIHARYLRDMNEAVEIAKLPLEPQYPRYAEWRRRKGDVQNVGDGLRLGGWDEDMILRDHALLRCGLVALAAERYRRAHGNWPPAAADLVPAYLPAVPLDPFDGQPLRYRRTDGGVVVYSIGEDQRDDGGDANPPPGEYTPRDIVFRLWDVARRRQPPKPSAPASPRAGGLHRFGVPGRGGAAASAFGVPGAAGWSSKSMSRACSISPGWKPKGPRPLLYATLPSRSRT